MNNSLEMEGTVERQTKTVSRSSSTDSLPPVSVENIKNIEDRLQRFMKSQEDPHEEDFEK